MPTAHDTQQVVAKVYAALRAGDLPTVLSLMSPDFVGVMTEGLPHGIGGEHSSPETMMKNCWGVVARHYELRPEPDGSSLLDDGRVLVLGRYRGSARATGKVVDAGFAHVLTLSDGRISRWLQYTDSAAWHVALTP